MMVYFVCYIPPKMRYNFYSQIIIRYFYVMFQLDIANAAARSNQSYFDSSYEIA